MSNSSLRLFGPLSGLRPPRAQRALVSAAFGCAILSLSAFAVAADVEPIDPGDAAQIASEVDTDVARMRRDLDLVAKTYGAPLPGEVGRVERRLREGEIHFLLNDYLRASIVLLDVVDDESNRSHPRYDECVYILAESLRRSKNYSGARRYFEDILPRVRGERLKDTVLALLEIASVTDHYEEVERYIGRLREAGTLSRPDVDYIYGKMLFKGSANSAGGLQHAYEVFRSVPGGNSISGQASYYAGVALVKLNRYEEAIKQFEQTLSRISSSRDAAQLRELTHLSLGRLYQEIGDVTKSVDAYQEISQSSPYFGDMLYEVAWTHVRAANQAKDPEERKLGFVRGLRATELLMATAPDSRLYPQARILEGNLQIRLGASESAYDTFQTIIDRYGEAQGKLDEILAANADPKKFFDQLIAADLHDLGAASILPPVALNWALEEQEMSRAVSMNQDLAESRKFIEESRELVRMLSEALQGEQRYGMFPGMGAARAKAVSIENRLVNLNRRLLNLERRMVWPYVGQTERAAIDAAHDRASSLETDVQALPQTEEEVESSKVQIKGAYQVVGRHAYKQTYRVASMRAQVVAVEVWLNQNRGQLTAEEVQILEERIASSRQDIVDLEKSLQSLQSDIRTAEVVSGFDGGRVKAVKLRDAYSAVVAQEVGLLRSNRGRVPANLQGSTARVDQQRAMLQQIDQDLRRLEERLDLQVEKRVGELQLAIATEVDRLNKYDAEQGELVASTDLMLGPVAKRTLNQVGKTFRDFVLQADVGIIDVAWARKQAETKKVNDLIKEQQDRALELENEFVDVLEEH